jgi:hypothetical protein
VRKLDLELSGSKGTNGRGDYDDACFEIDMLVHHNLVDNMTAYRR